MGSDSRAGTRRLLRVLALSAVVIGVIATLALAAGPGGWDHLGQGATQGSKSLNLAASALEVTPGAVYVGGKFTDAGGNLNADRIATWNGSNWNAVSSSTEQISTGEVFAIAVSGGKVYAGGTFTAGNSGAENLAVWDGTSWEPFCILPGESIGNVQALQVIGSTLYVGGDFQDGAGIDTADYLLACDLASPNGTPSATTVDPAHPFSGPVKALTATSDGTLYAGGRFGNLENIAAADNVAYRDGTGWHAMGTGGGPCTCALDAYVRGLSSNGTDVFVGTEGSDVAGIVQADHVAKWDGSTWSAMGSNSGGTDGWFPVGTNIYDLISVGPNVFATGTFANADGDARADNIAFFDGTAWHPVGSNGAGNGPWSGEGHSLAVVERQLYAAGNFTSAGGDLQAQSVASFALTQVIAYPTPTVTPGPSAQPTPTVTPGPSAVPTPTVTPSPPPLDVKPPATLLRGTKIDQAKRKATFRFASGEQGSSFACKLDRKSYKRCTSPKTYKKLAPGKHVFRVRARDRAGNVDRTPTVKRFKIKKR
jgi:hypothetical protein